MRRIFVAVTMFIVGCSDGKTNKCSGSGCESCSEAADCDDDDACTTDSCVDSACQHLDKVCDAPPAATCTDAATLHAPETIGSCDTTTGDCTYEASDITCADVCATATCDDSGAVALCDWSGCNLCNTEDADNYDAGSCGDGLGKNVALAEGCSLKFSGFAVTCRGAGTTSCSKTQHENIYTCQSDGTWAPEIGSFGAAGASGPERAIDVWSDDCRRQSGSVR